MRMISLNKASKQNKTQDYGKFYDEGIKKGLTNVQASLYAHDLLAKKYNYKNPFTIKQK